MYTYGLLREVSASGDWDVISSVSSGLFFGITYLYWPVLQPGDGVPVGNEGEIVAVVSGRQLGVNDTSSTAMSP